MNIYTRMLICLAAVAVLAAPSCAAPTPFVIGGWIFYENGTDCDDPAVNITNMGTGVEWQAVTAANYYQSIYTNGTDLNKSEQLQFSAKSPDWNQTNVTERIVAQSEVDAGGIFGFNITLGQTSGDADLNVTDVEVNPNCSSTGDAIFVNQSNEICATVYNAGPGNVTGNFDVCFYDDATIPPSHICSTTVTGGLTAGANTTVCINWIPSCVDYPGLSGDYLAIRVPTTLNVTVDCNGAVNETDETNNTLLRDTEVSANGYKSKNFDCSSDDPLTPFKYAGDLFTGGLAYNVSGTKQVLVPSDTQTRVHHIELPSGATVADARLYIAYYDDFGNPSPGCLANLSVNLTGPCGSETFTTPGAMYTDQKAYGTTYNLPKGKYAYNITSLVCDTSNDYSVTVENTDLTNTTVLLGGILVVVYEGGDETIQLWWQEGCDLLSGRTKYCSSTTEATATVAFPGSINLTTVGTAELITVVDQGMENGCNMLFNGNVIKTDAWNTPSEAYPGSMINVENVTVSVSASGNTMGFQDTGTMGMQADLAFLVVELVPKLHHINVTPTSKTLNINESRNFTATGHVRNGGNISNLVFAWSNSNPYVGSLNTSTGTAVAFTAKHVGITYLTASNNSVTSGQVQVTVNGAANNTNVTNVTVFTATSGNATVTGSFSNNLTGWIITTAIGNATNSSEVNQSNPRYGLGSGDKIVSGVTINVSDDSNIRSELAKGKGTIHIEICYNATTLAALGIDASTLAIWKYDNDTEKWVKQSSTRSGTCVYIDVDHLCTFGLFGSKATGGGSTGGGGGTYPPGWFGTPTPTVTATKAPAATPASTAAPPGERVTPAATKTKPAVTKATTSAADGTTAEKPTKGAPGFTAIFAIAGMLAIAYAMMRRRG